MLRTPLRAALVALVLALVLPSLAAAALPTVRIVAAPGAATVTGADALAPGATQFAVSTSGRGASVSLVRLNAGRTAAELMAAAARERDTTKLQEIGTFMGGASVARGQRMAFDVELTAAAYVLVEVTRRPKNVGEFTVAGTPTGTLLPQGDRTIRLKDFKIVAPGRLPRNGAIRVVNQGPSPHFIVGFPLKRASDLRAALSYMKQGKFRKFEALIGGPPASIAELLSPGIANVMHVKLQRGAWVLACFYSDHRSRHAPHAALGMVTGVRVR
jgi:hypothetical protein